tara:strand:- start:196 stop:447 length:252 start_codon:yes stop_codon:yes gene_type:complete
MFINRVLFLNEMSREEIGDIIHVSLPSDHKVQDDVNKSCFILADTLLVDLPRSEQGGKLYLFGKKEGKFKVIDHSLTGDHKDI